MQEVFFFRPLAKVRKMVILSGAKNLLRYFATLRFAQYDILFLQEGFFFDFSNYGVYERLGDDGITTWHPAFLALGENLEECSRKYKSFCYQYKPQEKSAKKFHWGSQLLPKLTRKKKSNKKKKQGKQSPDQDAKRLYENWRENNPEIVEVAEKFILANCYNPTHVGEFLRNYEYY